MAAAVEIVFDVELALILAITTTLAPRILLFVDALNMKLRVRVRLENLGLIK